MLNPFGTTFESLEGPIGPVVESVHQAAYQGLLDLIQSEDGHLISLRAPRAGYGKTMLLARLKEKTRGKVTMVPVHLADGQRIVGEGILEETLTQLTESVPAMAGLTRLDLYTRRLFAHGLLPLVYSGVVPCQDKDGAVASLRERPTEAFDFHHQDAAIAQWSKQQFDVLSPRLSSVLSKASGASSRDTSYWIDLFFNFAVRSPQEASRIGDLMNAVFGRESRFRSGAGFLDGLGAFLNLVTLVEPVVLVLDEVDGLSSDTDAALRATSSLVSLWEACRRVSVVVSVNDDVWESAFSPRLPAGLRDRLEDVVIRLRSLTLDEASSLISARAGAESVKVINKLDLSLGDLYPRGVLKAARDVWSRRNEPGAIADEPVVEEEGESPGGFAASKPVSSPVVVHQFRAQIAPDVSYPPLTQQTGVKSSAAGFTSPEPQQSPFSTGQFSMDEPILVTPLPVPERQGSSFDATPSSGTAAERQEVHELPHEDVGRLYPANPPFDPSIAIEEMKSDDDSFLHVPTYGSDQASQSGGSGQQSPFEIVMPAPPSSPPAPQSRQEAAPQADADAIDELLRQFREHRES
jgi:hypothetical protein